MKIPPFERKQDRVVSCPLDLKGSLQALRLVSSDFKDLTLSPLPVRIQIHIIVVLKLTSRNRPISAGEEAQNPRRTIPLAICMCLGVVFIAYSAMAAVLTLIWPYYLQVCFDFTNFFLNLFFLIIVFFFVFLFFFHGRILTLRSLMPLNILAGPLPVG